MINCNLFNLLLISYKQKGNTWSGPHKTRKIWQKHWCEFTRPQWEKAYFFGAFDAFKTRPQQIKWGIRKKTCNFNSWIFRSRYSESLQWGSDFGCQEKQKIHRNYWFRNVFGKSFGRSREKKDHFKARKTSCGSTWIRTCDS